MNLFLFDMGLGAKEWALRMLTPKPLVSTANVKRVVRVSRCEETIPEMFEVSASFDVGRDNLISRETLAVEEIESEVLAILFREKLDIDFSGVDRRQFEVVEANGDDEVEVKFEIDHRANKLDIFGSEMKTITFDRFHCTSP